MASFCFYLQAFPTWWTWRFQRLSVCCSRILIHALANLRHDALKKWRLVDVGTLRNVHVAPLCDPSLFVNFETPWSQALFRASGKEKIAAMCPFPTNFVNYFIKCIKQCETKLMLKLYLNCCTFFHETRNSMCNHQLYDAPASASICIIHHKLESISINQHQSESISINQNLRASINDNIIVNKKRKSMYIGINGHNLKNIAANV